MHVHYISPGRYMIYLLGPFVLSANKSSLIECVSTGVHAGQKICLITVLVMKHHFKWLHSCKSLSILESLKPGRNQTHDQLCWLVEARKI